MPSPSQVHTVAKYLHPLPEGHARKQETRGETLGNYSMTDERIIQPSAKDKIKKKKEKKGERKIKRKKRGGRGQNGQKFEMKMTNNNLKC